MNIKQFTYLISQSLHEIYLILIYPIIKNIKCNVYITYVNSCLM